MKSITLSAFAASIFSASQLLAGTTAIAPGPEPVMTTTTESGWFFTLGLYAWGAGLGGDIGAAGFVAPVDLKFSDILETLDMTAMGMMELRKGPWWFQLEGLYLRNSEGNEIAYTPIRQTPISADLVAKTTRLEAIAGYRFMDNGRTSVDLFGGVVYYDISNELDLRGQLLSTTIKSSENWFDPTIGMRVRHRFNDRWSTSLRGEVGGFGVSSDFLWQAAALFGYDINESSTCYFGWRHAAVDYQNGGFLYDVYSSGPILGVIFSW